VPNNQMLKVVIDTNVFISALSLPQSRPANVVLLARKKTILNVISPQILKEVERIIKKKLFWDNSKTPGAVRWIKNFSEEVHPQGRLAIIADDPDNRILECAVAGQASAARSFHHLTKQEARAFTQKWNLVNSAERQELASTPVAQKFRQLEALLVLAKQLGWTDLAAHDDGVWERWTKLRRISNV
jgi:uncharacterized protein